MYNIFLFIEIILYEKILEYNRLDSIISYKLGCLFKFKFNFYFFLYSLKLFSQISKLEIYT